MSEAQTAAAEAVETNTEETSAAAPAPSSTKELVELFITGATEGAVGNVSIAGSLLTQNGSEVARRGGGVVLMPNSTSDVELNDTLIATLATSGTSFRRIPNFSRLTRAADRVGDLDSGRIDNFRDVAKVFGLSFTESEIESLQTAKNFRERVSTFYTELAAAEAAVKAEAERLRAEAAAEAQKKRLAEQALGWDRGEGERTNYDLKGVDGVRQRLRVKVNGGKSPKRRIEGSEGHQLGIKTAESIYQIAAEQWKRHAPGTYSGRLISRYLGSYTVEVYSDRLSYGCQNVSRAEVERIAIVAGWADAPAEQAAA